MVHNFDNVAKKCNINQKGSPDKVVALINDLNNIYNAEDLKLIYLDFLKRAKNSKILIHIIKLLDLFRDPDTLDIYLDILLLNNDFSNAANNIENFEDVRIFIIKAIANLKDTRAVVPLLYCLNNKKENYKIRLNCADALGKIGDKYAVQPLMDLVIDENEKSVYIKESAAVALGMIGDMRAIDPLVSILEANRGLIDKFTFLKERVLEVLSKFNFKSERVFNALKISLSDESPQIRINAIEALMNTEEERAIPLIKKKLKDSDDEVKRNAVIALYNMLGIEILNEILNNSEYSDICKIEAQNIIDEYETEE